MYLIKSPLRISLFGGGTDLKSYYKYFGSDIVAFTIDKFIYTNISFIDHRFNNFKYRFSYSQAEEPKKINDINNDTIREFIKFFKISDSLYISTFSDLPHGNGLGSSSSFAASLFYAYFKHKKKMINKNELAKMVCDLEINKIKAPIGIQDQHACIFGGFNYFSFDKEGNLKLKKLNNLNSLITKINNRSIISLFNLDNIDRKKILLEQQKKNIQSKNFKFLNEMQQLSKDFIKNSNSKHNYELMCEFLNESWKLKKNVSSKISNDFLENQINYLKDNGSISNKLLGAGGKGFILSFFKDKQSRDKFYEKSHNKIKMTKFSIYHNSQSILKC